MARKQIAFSRQALLPRADRAPVNTYDQALSWLVQAYRLLETPLAPDESLPPSAVLVCDLFWVTETTLRADLTRRAQSFNAMFSKARPRGPYQRAY